MYYKLLWLCDPGACYYYGMFDYFLLRVIMRSGNRPIRGEGIVLKSWIISSSCV